MDGIYATTVQVQARDCDSLRHVNNAVYVEYLREATLKAHSVTEVTAPDVVMTCLSIEYKTPAVYDDTLEIVTWASEAVGDRVIRHYRITRPADGRPVVAATAAWHFPSLPPPLVTDAALPLKPFAAPDETEAVPFTWRQRVQRGHLDLRGVASVTSYLNWLEEATFRAAGAAGWSWQRMWDNDLVILQYRRDTQFLADAGLGDTIEIQSRYVFHARLRGAWRHAAYRLPPPASGQPPLLLLRDYSTGVFLDTQFRPRAGVEGMAAALRAGALDGKPTQEV